MFSNPYEAISKKRFIRNTVYEKYAVNVSQIQS